MNQWEYVHLGHEIYKFKSGRFCHSKFIDSDKKKLHLHFLSGGTLVKNKNIQQQKTIAMSTKLQCIGLQR